MTDQPMTSAVIYHVWFATKRRKWLLQGDIEERIKELLLDTAHHHGIHILALETVIDHVHVLLRLNGSQNLSMSMNLLKGVSARRVFEEFPDLKLDAHTEHFWQKRCGSKPVPPEAISAVTSYIRTQKERLEKYERPFRGR